MDLPRRLSELRVRAGLTKTALAKPRYTVSFVSQIESGRRRPSPEATAYFASRLGVSAQYLATGIPEDVGQELTYLLEHGQAEMRQGRVEEAEALFRDTRNRAGQVELPAVANRALVLIAEALAQQGRPNEAIDAYEEALESALPERERGFAVAGLAKLYRTVGDLTYAAELVESFLSRSKADPVDPALIAELQSVLVSIYFERGDTRRAERCARRALAVAAGTPSLEVRARSYWDAGTALAEASREEEALEFATRARMLMEEVASRRNVAGLHDAAAILCLKADPPRLKEAEEHLERAAGLTTGTGATARVAQWFGERARLEIKNGRPGAALEYAEEGRAGAGPNELEVAHSLLTKGRALAALGHADQAREVLHEAVALFRRNQAPEEEAACWRELGELDLVEGKVSQAAEALRFGLQALDPAAAPKPAC